MPSWFCHINLFLASNLDIFSYENEGFGIENTNNIPAIVEFDYINHFAVHWKG